METKDERITINGVEIRQPDEGLLVGFETTYTSDTTRTQDGVLHATAMFTVEALTYSAKYVKPEEASVILRLIAGGRPFRLHYFSPYYGVWRDGDFYVGQGSLSVKRLTRGDAMLEGLTFQMTGVDPIKDD